MRLIEAFLGHRQQNRRGTAKSQKSDSPQEEQLNFIDKLNRNLEAQEKNCSKIPFVAQCPSEEYISSSNIQYINQDPLQYIQTYSRPQIQQMSFEQRGYQSSFEEEPESSEIFSPSESLSNMNENYSNDSTKENYNNEDYQGHHSCTNEQPLNSLKHWDRQKSRRSQNGESSRRLASHPVLNICYDSEDSNSDSNASSPQQYNNGSQQGTRQRGTSHQVRQNQALQQDGDMARINQRYPNNQYFQRDTQSLNNIYRDDYEKDQQRRQNNIYYGYTKEHQEVQQQQVQRRHTDQQQLHRSTESVKQYSQSQLEPRPYYDSVGLAQSQHQLAEQEQQRLISQVVQACFGQSVNNSAANSMALAHPRNQVVYDTDFNAMRQCVQGVTQHKYQDINDYYADVIVQNLSAQQQNQSQQCQQSPIHICFEGANAIAESHVHSQQHQTVQAKSESQAFIHKAVQKGKLLGTGMVGLIGMVALNKLGLLQPGNIMMKHTNMLELADECIRDVHDQIQRDRIGNKGQWNKQNELNWYPPKGCSRYLSKYSKPRM